ncbi:restriction endonuclease [Mycolicibacterium neoaurum]|uniref:restriction endonuclease n=1 Tax=Mycolicibacterium neoaurum TaxID=1795 RepID=UPI00248B72A4|nr:restriction endonuclease [Mycolicibacterium neoaurum]WBP92975.1 restriction endonuclease [Mycolicibacterium neoaurum]WBS06624.1 restriction endonuclease [Mycolicibacterium neoaurum]
MRLTTFLTIGIIASGAALLYGAGAITAVSTGLAVPLLAAAMPHFLTGLRTPSTGENPIDTMSGVEFEDYVARIARSCGVSVIMTSTTGDWGVDLIVGRRPDRLAIQCKRVARPVGTGAVQEVVAGAAMQECTHTMVVTNNGFTPAARKLAERHGCILVGGADLPRLKTLIRERAAPAR